VRAFMKPYALCIISFNSFEDETCYALITSFQ